MGAYLALCGVRGKEFQELAEFVAQPNQLRWIHAHHDSLPDEVVRLIHDEPSATVVTCHDPLLVPVLLRTSDYSRTQLSNLGLSGERIERGVVARTLRQDQLSDWRGPQFTFYLRERALTQDFGEPAVMHEQLMHLMLTATSNRRVTIRVVTQDVDKKVNVADEFRMLWRADWLPVVYLEHRDLTVITDDVTDITAFKRTITVLDKYALDATASRTVLAEYANAYDKIVAQDLHAPETFDGGDLNGDETTDTGMRFGSL